MMPNGIYPRLVLTGVRTEFSLTCHKCGAKVEVNKIVELDLTRGMGTFSVENLSRMAIRQAWPEGWADDDVFADESGGPGRYHPIQLCPKHSQGKTK